MNKMVVLAVLLWIVVVIIPVTAILTVYLPAHAEYNKKFASRVTMAYDQASFEGMREQITILWNTMNSTFTGDYSLVYNTPWYWEQTYDNSLASQRDYLKALTRRIDTTIEEQNAILNGSKTIIIPYYQWYQQNLDSLRTEMKREGGLDWAINGAWFLTFAPTCYWLFWWLLPLEIILAIIALICTFKALE